MLYKLFQLQQGSIYEEFLLLSTKNISFLKFLCNFKETNKKKLSGDFGQNIYRHYRPELNTGLTSQDI